MDKEKKEIATPLRLEWLKNKHGLENVDHSYTDEIDDFIDDMYKADMVEMQDSIKELIKKD